MAKSRNLRVDWVADIRGIRRWRTGSEILRSPLRFYAATKP